MTRGDARQTPSRGTSFGHRLRVGAAGTIAIGGAVVMGGAATLVTAFANTGEVAVSQSCTTYSASASLDNNVDHRLVIVSFPDASTKVINGEFTTLTNTSSQVIWSTSGASPKTGTVTETIYNGLTVASGVDGTPKSATLVAPSNCNSAISTTPSAGGVVGTAIHDSATVTGTLGSPTGTVVFSLFPPSNATCSGTGDKAVYTSSPIQLTSGTAGSSNAADTGSFTTTAPGVYHWVAVYSGDTTYKGATSNCADEAETISTASPAITTKASPSNSVPFAASDTATVTGGVSPTGTVVFTLYPNAADCTAKTGALYTSPAEALSGGTATSGTFTLTTASTTPYQWVAAYSGDANNAAVSSACGDEPVTAGSGPQGITTTVPTTPSTGSTGSLTGITVGGFLLLGGLGFALISVLVPRRRHTQ